MPAAVPIPANATDGLKEYIWKNAAAAALSAAQGAAEEVDHEVIAAVVESARVASESRSAGRLGAIRQPSGEIKISVTELEAGWRSIALENSSAPAAGAEPASQDAQQRT